MAHNVEENIREILQLGYELPAVECKAAAPIQNAWICGQVLRAMVGMTNLQDGGLVLIGIQDKQGKLQNQGVSPADLATWTYDDLSSKAAPYFEPAIRFKLTQVTVGASSYVAIEVEEFEEQPALVRKTYNCIDPAVGGKTKTILREGGCYVRSMAKRETREVPTSEDMRTLLEIAIQKGVNKWVRSARIAGVIPPLAPTGATAFPADADLFHKQLGGL